ncbi:MAG: 7-cyano-7-deazaguanine synthase QueC [Bdellovibrionales bacterium]|nr:7-cyano-7-deazaguanine synthase QueC [Bdellovibrionales bacterium]
MGSKEKAVVLLSGGLDSSYNLWLASKDYEVVLALTFDYGQKASVAEVVSSAALCQKLNISHKVITLPWFKDFSRSALTSEKEIIPTKEKVKLDDKERSLSTARQVWVPNRNGIFLNIAAGYAEGWGASTVLIGFNKEEAQTFPDNSLSYQQVLNQALKYSTASGVQIKSFCGAMTKAEIISHGLKMGLPLNLLWPCYFSGSHWCGECESCLRFKRALEGQKIELREALPWATKI